MTKEPFFAATRSFIHANIMYRQFQNIDAQTSIRDFNHYPVTEQGTYLLLWYALLFNVCAFLKEQQSIPPDIQNDLDSVYSILKDFRNVVLHIPDDFGDHDRNRFKLLLLPDAFKKCVRIHLALSDFFDAKLQSYGETTDLLVPKRK